MHNVFATDNQVDVHVDIFPVLGIQGAGVTISSLSIFPPYVALSSRTTRWTYTRKKNRVQGVRVRISF